MPCLALLLEAPAVVIRVLFNFPFVLFGAMINALAILEQKTMARMASGMMSDLDSAALIAWWFKMATGIDMANSTRNAIAPIGELPPKLAPNIIGLRSPRHKAGP